MGLAPLVDKIRGKYGIARQRVFIGIVAFSLLVFFGLASVCIFRLYDLSLGDDREKTVAVIKSLRESVGSASGVAQQVTQNLLSSLGVKAQPRIGETTDTMMRKIGEWSLQAASRFFASLPEFFIHFVVFVLMLFVFFRYSKRIRLLLVRSHIASAEEVDTVTELLRTSGGSMLSTNLIVGAIQASAVTVGAAIVGLNEWSVIFTITLICSFIPVIGAAPIGLILAGFCFSLGSKGSGIFLVLVAIASGTIDNVIRPYLVARSEENLNPFVGLVGIIGAIIVFGFHGIFLGPFIMSVASSAIPKLLEALDKKPV